MGTRACCLTANFIGRHPGYPMRRCQWTQYQSANEAFFRPTETFSMRFDALLADIQQIGFDAVDLWEGTLNPLWATQAYFDAVNEALSRRSMSVQSLSGNVGDDLESVQAFCRAAKALDCRVLCGDCAALQTDFPGVVALLRQEGMRLAVVNRWDKTPGQLLERIHDGVAGVVGVCVDSGAFVQQDYEPQQALKELAPVLMYTRFRDVKAQGAALLDCRFGQGVVNLPRCVQALEQIQYQGCISVVNESTNAGPQDDLKASLRMLNSWLR